MKILIVVLTVAIVGAFISVSGITAFAQAGHHCYDECEQQEGGATHAGNPNDDDTWVCCGNPNGPPGGAIAQTRCTPAQQAMGWYNCSKRRVKVAADQKHDAVCTE